jgi:hypothetical protein
MTNPSELPVSFDCLATAALLRSGTNLALAGHVAVVISMLSIWNGGPAGWIQWCSVLVWCSMVYLAIRVKIEGHFFDLLAVHPAEQLDVWLDTAGLRKKTSSKTIDQRRRGALRIWRALVVAVTMQIALMLPALLRRHL